MFLDVRLEEFSKQLYRIILGQSSERIPENGPGRGLERTLLQHTKGIPENTSLKLQVTLRATPG